MSTLAVKNWERFQHYGDRRDPPWIKLYRDLLSSESWVLGTDLSRLVQLASALLAARYQNAIPFNFDLIKKVTSLDCSEVNFNKAINHLVATNFLEIHDASAVLATGASNTLATVEKSRGEENRKEERREDAHARATPAIEGLNPQAWESWITYRTSIRKPLKPASIPAAQRTLAAFGSEQVAVVEQSIGNGWTGLFGLKTTNGAGWREKPYRKAPTSEELEAKERAHAN